MSGHQRPALAFIRRAGRLCWRCAMADLKPIETRYNGYRFRSRLEARWAVFFDALGIEWEYEKEGYDLGEAGWYLPDFWLPGMDMFAEIKGQELTQGEKCKIAALAKASDRLVAILGPKLQPIHCGQDNDFRVDGSQRCACPCGGAIDGCLEFGICSGCGDIVFGHLGTHYPCYDCDRHEPLFCDGKWNPDDDRHPRIVKAFRKARSARFEHGERG